MSQLQMYKHFYYIPNICEEKCGEGCWYRVGVRHYVQRRCLFNWYGIQIVIGVAYQLNMERRKARKGCEGRKKRNKGW